MTRFRSIAFVCTLLALAPGCAASPPVAPRAPTVAPLEAERERLATQMADIEWQVHGPLRAFLAGPAGACQSADLTEAVRVATGLPAEVAMAGGDFNSQLIAAALLLDTADGAAAHGCPEVARALYLTVIETYIGVGYAALRQRAEIGLAELREAAR
jgi:hypothetical protein